MRLAGPLVRMLRSRAGPRPRKKVWQGHPPPGLFGRRDAPVSRAVHRRALFIVLAASLVWVPSHADGPLERERAIAGVRIWYAPRTNLQEIDRALIASARERIDMAAYVLTDHAVMSALIEAARRGVKIRIYLDPDQPASRTSDRGTPFWTLLRTAGVATRMKFAGRDIMHLKAYHVDGRVLRTGSTNFSVSGARYQDNDLILVESRDAVAQFVRQFDYLWTRSGSEPFTDQPQRR